MKYRLDFDPEHRVLLVNLSDDITEPEYLALRAEVERFLQIEGPCHGIIDFSGVSNFHISAAFTRKLAEEPPTFPASNIRVCVTTKPVIIGMIRMFQIIGGKSREKVYIV